MFTTVEKHSLIYFQMKAIHTTVEKRSLIYCHMEVIHTTADNKKRALNTKVHGTMYHKFIKRLNKSPSFFQKWSQR